MKKVAPLLAGFCILFISGLTAQYIANGDLEDWETQENLISVKVNPKGWTTRNFVDENPQAIYCYNTGDSYSGYQAAVCKISLLLQG